MRIYTGTKGWGWRLFGIGYKDHWFFGVSIREEDNDGPVHYDTDGEYDV